MFFLRKSFFFFLGMIFGCASGYLIPRHLYNSVRIQDTRVGHSFLRGVKSSADRLDIYLFAIEKKSQHQYLAPPTSNQNIFYFTSNIGKVYAVDLKEKKILWVFHPFLMNGVGFIGILGNRVLCAHKERAGTRLTVYALSSLTGKQKWIWQTRGQLIHVEKKGGLVLFQTAWDVLRWGWGISQNIHESQDKLFALNLSTGKPAWKMTDFSRTVFGKNTAYFSCGSRSICGVDLSTGNLKWKTYLHFPVEGPVVLHKNKLFCATYSFDGKGDRMYAINPRNGMVLWNYLIQVKQDIEAAYAGGFPSKDFPESQWKRTVKSIMESYRLHLAPRFLLTPAGESVEDMGITKGVLWCIIRINNLSSANYHILYAIQANDGNFIHKFFISLPYVIKKEVIYTSQGAFSLITGGRKWKFSLSPSGKAEFHPQSFYLYKNSIIVKSETNSWFKEIYAFQMLNGKRRWKYKYNAKPFHTAYFYKDKFFFLSNAYKFFLLSLKTGKARKILLPIHDQINRY
jgi:outer membrane protein assembly factor BamB